MDDHVFEFDGIEFGLHRTIGVEQSGFQPGSANPADDIATWVFEGFLNVENEPGALETLAALRRRWARKRDPAEYASLRYGLGGRTRRVYGKPAAWDQAIDNRLLGGGGGVSMEFVTADRLHYDDVEQQHVLNIAPSSLGGYPVPFVTPWSSLHSGVSERAFLVGGDAPAPFTVQITGPLTNGWVAGSDWRIELASALAGGASAVVDTRPWSYGVTGALLAGTTTRLSRARLNPAGETMSFGGTSAAGTATATIRWRPAWSSL